MSERRMFPMLDGPSIPWEAMEPHEARCQKNHSQSLADIARRHGFGAGEAWAIVNNLDFEELRRIGHSEAARLWVEYAERVNLHFAELEQLRSLRAKMAELPVMGPGWSIHKCVDTWRPYPALLCSMCSGPREEKTLLTICEEMPKPGST